MRVLFLTHRLPYTANRGDRIRAFHILQCLAGRAEVDLVSLVHSRDEASHAADLRGVAASVTIAPVSRIRSYSRAVVALGTARPLTHALLDAAGLTADLRRIVAARQPDVVLAYCSGMARFAVEPPLAPLPFVLDMVDVDSEKWRLLASTTRPPKQWIYQHEARYLSAFEASASRAARAVLVVNDRERESVLALAPEAHVRVVPNGVAVEQFRAPGEPSNELRVTFCGVMNYRPNEDAALWIARSVWPIVRASRPEARLSLVGSDPTPALQRLPASDPTIEVTGSVPDVPPYLWRSAVGVAPLFVARGVQNKVLEAVAAGLPTVVTPAVAEGLPATVLAACAVAANPEDFAAAVLAFLDRTPAERRAIADRANIGTLSWGERLAPLMTILDEARLGRPMPPADPNATTR